jgi:hypothetical protein
MLPMRLPVRTTIAALAVAIAAPLTASGTQARTHGPTPTPLPTNTPTPTATPSTSGYSGAVAAAYADAYWSSYNPQYPSFANSGGDCTNFVSQAMHAGGLAFRTPPAYSGDAAWYITNSSGRWSYSLPWVNANDNHTFLSTTLPGVTQVASVYGVAPGQTVASNAAQGDIVLYDWTNDGTFDHEAIVTTADGQSVDAHTNNRYHAYWTLAQYNSQWATTHIVVLHITPGTT